MHPALFHLSRGSSVPGEEPHLWHLLSSDHEESLNALPSSTISEMGAEDWVVYAGNVPCLGWDGSVPGRQLSTSSCLSLHKK